MRPNVVFLVNANEMRPPVAPLALDYLAGTLVANGFEASVIDLAFAADWKRELEVRLAASRPIAVGVTFRNTDDSFWPSGTWFVPRLREIVSHLRTVTEAPVIIGGCGYSIFPAQILDACGADLGFAGDNEVAFMELARGLSEQLRIDSVPGVVHRANGRTIVNAPSYPGSLDLPSERSWIDNARYFREGAMGGVETKSGCPGQCIYCADPLAKANRARCRPAGDVADEFASLLRQGVDVVHLCDGEFNIPYDHALSVCEMLTDRGLGERIRWYCYAAISPFDRALALAMRRAGCVGINFGADSGCDRMLETLGRAYRRAAIQETVAACREAGIAVMLDLLLGAPGETEASVRETVSFIKAVDPDRAGAAVGVRVYPGTPLARIVREQGIAARNPNLRGAVEDNDDFFKPVFYIDRALGESPGALVAAAIGGDTRFFQPAGGDRTADYNYNANEVLAAAIARGERGAFWDILRRIG